MLKQSERSVAEEKEECITGGDLNQSISGDIGELGNGSLQAIRKLKKEQEKEVGWNRVGCHGGFELSSKERPCHCYMLGQAALKEGVRMRPRNPEGRRACG